ncbi:hypothetical protein K474DRAFT_1667609 [Panus rudis PR-1116 ss-1]|nr:hypothetical protein K474DRAFT_1667609 [Panus rudis PR-1116 ss-1]
MSTPVQGYAKVSPRDSAEFLELQKLNSRSNVPQPGNGIGATNGTTMSAVHEHGGWERPHFHTYLGKQQVFWNRLRGKDRPTRVPGWGESLRNIALSSYLNAFLVCIPIAWVAHFHMRSEHNEEGVFPESVTFALCFLSIIPLEKMFDWGGEQMSLYLGKSIGDLLIVTLNNAVEATLAIILMAHCELRLLQSTIIGVVILHLLLIPGTAFLTGGAQIWEQNLHPHTTQLNHSLLIIGVMTILLPTAFFAALDRGVVIQAETGATGFSSELISDHSRDQLLRMSRGVAVCLLVVYIASRVFLANPPGDDNALEIHDNAPEALKREEEELLHTEPLVNPWVCMITLVITVGIMAATAEWLVESIEFVREAGGITEEWFGLILLPIVSFSADGAVAVVYFVRSTINHFLGRKTLVPQELAKARAIDLSIQFTLFWMPFLVLLAWWVGKPLTLMFDYFEVALLLGSCFLVNYVTADAKTNWVEGLIMVAFYFMIATCSWFYGGQPEVEIMLSCPQSIAEAFAAAAAENSGGEGDPVAISSRALSHSSRALFGY